MPVELKKITDENFNDCIGLKVSETQKGYVATNVYSLAQAWLNYETAYPFAICADGAVVGFVMMGFYEEKNAYTFWRFMVDERFQGNGYGKAALRLSMQYLKDKFNAKEAYLSFVPGNTKAETLYESIGFQKTGVIDGGELEMRIDLEKFDAGSL